MSRITSALAVCALLASTALCRGSTISLQGNGYLLPNTPGQTITLLISGSDYYVSSDLYTLINGGTGPAPVVTHAFSTAESGLIPAENLAGTVWGIAGLAHAEYGTTSDGSGLKTRVGMGTAGNTLQNTEGVYATLTISTVGVPSGSYTMSFEGSQLIEGVQPGTNEIIFAPLQIPDITLNTFIAASPSPTSSIVLNNSLAPSTPVDLSGAVQISNDGVVASALTVQAATITGPDADLFEIPGGFSPFELQAGDNPLDVGFRFKGATAPGTYTAEVAFSFNEGPQLTYPLVVTVVPEPATWLLASLGFAALVVASRKRK